MYRYSLTQSGVLLSSGATRILIRFSSMLLAVAFEGFVREDALDHAIWTVAVVSHPVATDHHRHHSLELVSVEAPVIEIVVVIAHAMHFQLLLFLPLQQVEELGEGGGGNPGGSPGGSGGPGVA